MSRIKSSLDIVKCPNGCGTTFKVNYKYEPRGMVEHLTKCGNVNTVFSVMAKEQLEGFKIGAEV